MNTKTNMSTSWFKRRFGDFFQKFDPHARGFVKQTVDSVFVEYDNEKENCTNNNSDAARSKIVGLFFVPVAGVHSSIKYFNEDISEDLKELYAKINEQCAEENNKQFEVVQICFPHKPLYLGDIVAEDMKHEFDNRCMDVPWFALPYEGIEKNIRIRHYYGIRDGEFALVLLDAISGKLITRQGYDKLVEDRSGKLFPWTSPHVLQILKTVPRYLVGSQTDFKDQKIDLPTCSFQDIDRDAILGLYFSAHWCPPCKAFTSQLINTYKMIRENGHKFEIILVSSDRSADSYSHYVSMMPWLAIPYEDSDGRNKLTALYGIQGIPSLVLLNPDGSVITEDGRGEINEDPDGLNFPWHPKPVNILTPRLAGQLQKNPAVVLFTDGEEDVEIELATAVLTPVSEYMRKKYDDLLQFFIAVDSDTSESIREYLGLEDVSPLLTLIDTCLGRFAVMEYGKEITEKSIINFVNQFYSNELIFLPIDRP